MRFSPRFFHLDEGAPGQEVIGEGDAGSAIAAAAQALLKAARFQRALMPESLHQAVEEDLRLAFFVAFDIAAPPGNEAAERFF